MPYRTNAYVEECFADKLKRIAKDSKEAKVLAGIFVSNQLKDELFSLLIEKAEEGLYKVNLCDAVVEVRNFLGIRDLADVTTIKDYLQAAGLKVTNDTTIPLKDHMIFWG